MDVSLPAVMFGFSAMLTMILSTLLHRCPSKMERMYVVVVSGVAIVVAELLLLRVLILEAGKWFQQKRLKWLSHRL